MNILWPASSLKGQCHEIFELYFFSLIKPIWAPDKQAKMVFLKNLKFKKFDSRLANTARSQIFLSFFLFTAKAYF